MFRPGNLGHLGRLGLVAASRNAFSPLSLFAAGEQGFWYDPSDLSTLFQDAAGTVPVTSVEQPVGRMLDKSGRGNHATQSTAGFRRILRVDANGKYYLAHTGSTTEMRTGSVNMTGTDKMSVFVGVKKLSNAVEVFFEQSADSNTNSGAMYFSTGADAGVTGYASLSRGNAAANANQAATFSMTSNPDLAVLSVTHDIAGDRSAIRRNGVSGASALGDKGAGNFGNYPFFLFNRNGFQLQSTGDFYGLIVRGAMSGDAQISSTERWLADKTGVTM